MIHVEPVAGRRPPENVRVWQRGRVAAVEFIVVLMGGCSMVQDEALIESSRTAVDITEATLVALETVGGVTEVEQRQLVQPQRCQRRPGGRVTYGARRAVIALPSDTLSSRQFTAVVTDRWENDGLDVEVSDDGDVAMVQARVEGLEQLSALFLYGERYQTPTIRITADTECFPLPRSFDDLIDLSRQFDQLVDPATFGEPPS